MSKALVRALAAVLAIALFALTDPDLIRPGVTLSAQTPSCIPARVTPASTVRLGPDAQEFYFAVSGTGQSTYSCIWVPLASDAAWLTTGFVYYAPGAPPGFFGNFPAVVAANASGVSRTGHFTFNNGMGTITLIQDAGACAVVPPVVQATRSGGTLTIPIQTTTSDCGWSVRPASPSGNFASLVGPQVPFEGTGFQAVGPESIVLSVQSNETGSGPRSMTLLVGGIAMRIDQEAPLCVFSMVPTSAAFPAGGGNGTIALGGTGTDCSYTATAAGGVSLTSGATGVAPATIGYSVAPTTSQVASTASITVGGATLQISQAAPAITTDVPISPFAGVPSGLSFAHYRPASGASYTSGATPARLTNTDTPTAGWSASADQPWVTMSSPTGTTPGVLLIGVDPVQAALLPFGTSRATVSVASSDPAQGSRRIPVTLFVANEASTVVPRGAFDTPTGLQTYSGAFAVTGWALDDVGIARIVISRAAVASETPGTEIYIGDAVRVRGARPDAAAIWNSRIEGPQSVLSYYPDAQEAGWGYMLLSNALPGGGNGAYTLHVDAIDRDGRTRRLGSRVVNVDNANAIRPFGTIDSPAQGETVSGSIVNRGWVLTPTGKTIPIDGSTIKVYIDGVLVGPVTSYNLPRPDVKAIFPGLANSDGPEARLTIDTTLLADGVHTIAWGVIDDAGVAEGIGSRYFTVQNGGPAPVPPAGVSRATAAVASLPGLRTEVWSRFGVEDTGWAVRVEAQPDGSRRVFAPQGQRLEIFLDPMLRAACGTYDGHLVVNEVAGPLPMGASLDPPRGIFRWQPGPEVAGNFAFVFVQRGCDGAERRIPLEVVVR